MTTPLERLDSLDMSERHAFLAFFAGARSDLTVFVSGNTGKEVAPKFGKAECEEVPFREFWQHKLPALGLTTFEEGPPKPALGAVAGSTFTEVRIGVTEDGSAAREAWWRRLDQRSQVLSDLVEMDQENGLL